jgi:hypothetical protein
VKLVNEPLELLDAVAALVGGKALIDDKGHGLHCDAHLANGVLI